MEQSGRSTNEGTLIFVRGIPASCSKHDLLKLFCSVAQVERINLYRGKDIAVVQLFDRSSVDFVIDLLATENIQLNGCSLQLSKKSWRHCTGMKIEGENAILVKPFQQNVKPTHLESTSLEKYRHGKSKFWDDIPHDRVQMVLRNCKYRAPKNFKYKASGPQPTVPKSSMGRHKRRKRFKFKKKKSRVQFYPENGMSYESYLEEQLRKIEKETKMITDGILLQSGSCGTSTGDDTEVEEVEMKREKYGAITSGAATTGFKTEAKVAGATGGTVGAEGGNEAFAAEVKDGAGVEVSIRAEIVEATKITDEASEVSRTKRITRTPNQVFVKTSKSNFHIDLNGIESVSIQKIKEEIQARAGTPPDLQFLLARGSQLSEEALPQLQHGDSITVLVKGKGGMKTDKSDTETEARVQSQMRNLEITLKVQGDRTGHRYLRYSPNGDSDKITVMIPKESVGVDETIKISRSFEGPPKESIHLHCSTTGETSSQVSINKCNVGCIPRLHISADDVIINKSIRSDSCLSFEATRCIRISSKIICPTILLRSLPGSIQLSTESILQTKYLGAFASTTYIYGQIYVRDSKIGVGIGESRIHISVVGNLHIGTHGRLGLGAKSITEECSVVQLDVSNNLHNFGTISAKRCLQINCRNIKSGQHCSGETVQRNYAILEKSRMGISRRSPLDPQVSISIDELFNAIENGRVEAVTYLLRHNVDPNAPSPKTGVTATEVAFRRVADLTAAIKSGEAQNVDYLRRFGVDLNTAVPLTGETPIEAACRRITDDSEAISSLINSWERRSGIITAPNIVCIVTENIDDCSQLKGLLVHVEAGGNVQVAEDSIWSSGTVYGDCRGSFVINGIVKWNECPSLNIGRNLIIEKGSKARIANGGNIFVHRLFHNKNKFCSDTGQIMVTAGVVRQDEYCMMASHEKLTIKVIEDSKEICGIVSAKSVRLIIGASMEASCKIHSMNTCAVEFAARGDAHDYGHLLLNGEVEVTEGALVAQNCLSSLQGSDMKPDITITASLKTRGILASSVNIKFPSTSQTEICPNNTLPESDKPSVHCFFRALETEKGSALWLNTDQRNRDIIISCSEYWKHSGIVSVKKEGDFNILAIVAVSDLINRGRFSGFDTIDAVIRRQYTNSGVLLVKESLKLSGEGKIINEGTGIIQSETGCLEIVGTRLLKNLSQAQIFGNQVSISTMEGENAHNSTSKVTEKYDMRNNGKIISEEQLVVKAGNINNKGGEMKSMTSSVELIWSTGRYNTTKIEGIVQTPTLAICTAERSRSFLFKCSNVPKSLEKHLKDFRLPEDGLMVECLLGLVVIDKHISGDSILTVVSKKGCVLLKSVEVPVLYLVAFNEHTLADEDGSNKETGPKGESGVLKQRNGNLMQNESGVTVIYERIPSSPKKLPSPSTEDPIRNRNTTEDTPTLHECIKVEGDNLIKSIFSIDTFDFDDMIKTRSQHDFLLRLSNSSILTVEKIKAASIVPFSRVVLQTGYECVVVCIKSFWADSCLVIDGYINIDSCCHISAHALTFIPRSVIKIFASEPSIKEGSVVLFSTADILLAGVMTKCGDMGCSVILHCEVGSIESKGFLEVSNIIMVASNIRLSGTLHVNGSLRIFCAKNISITDNANIMCQTFICRNEEQGQVRTKFEFESGCLEVSGDMHCIVESFLICQKGKLLVSSNSVEDNLVIVSYNGYISGTVKCELKGTVAVSCTDKLFLEHLQADIKTPDCTLSSSNAVTVKDDCTLNFECPDLLICIDASTLGDTLTDKDKKTVGLSAGHSSFLERKEVMIGNDPVELPNNTITARSHFSCVCLSGNLQVDGCLRVIGAARVSIVDNANITCTSLLCSNEEFGLTCSTFELVSGRIQVHGNMKCITESFSVCQRGVLDVTSNCKDYVAIASEIGNLSGKIKLELKGNVSIHCSAELNLRSLEAKIQTPMCTLSSANAINIDRDCSLNLKCPDLLVYIISSTDSGVDKVITLSKIGTECSSNLEVSKVENEQLSNIIAATPRSCLINLSGRLEVSGRLRLVGAKNVSIVNDANILCRSLMCCNEGPSTTTTSTGRYAVYY